MMKLGWDQPLAGLGEYERKAPIVVPMCQIHLDPYVFIGQRRVGWLPSIPFIPVGIR